MNRHDILCNKQPLPVYAVALELEDIFLCDNASVVRKSLSFLNHFIILLGIYIDIIYYCMLLVLLGIFVVVVVVDMSQLFLFLHISFRYQLILLERDVTVISDASSCLCNGYCSCNFCCFHGSHL